MNNIKTREKRQRLLVIDNRTDIESMDEGRKCKTVGPSEGRGRLKEVNLIKKTYKEREKNRMRQKQDKNIRTEWNKGKYKDTR